MASVGASIVSLQQVQRATYLGSVLLHQVTLAAPMIVSLVAPSVNPSPVCLSWNEIGNNMQIQAPINIVTRANFHLHLFVDSYLLPPFGNN